MTALGVYVHVPYCATRCPYCDFSMVEEGLLVRDGEKLVLTLDGRLVADLVTRRLAA